MGTYKYKVENVMAKNSKQNANNPKVDDTPKETETKSTDTTDTSSTSETPTEAPDENGTDSTESTESEAPVENTVDTESEAPAPESKPSNVTISSNMPKPSNVRTVNASSASNSPYVTQLTSPTRAFIDIANDVNHTVEAFNRSKVLMANALTAAIKYEDGNEFVASLNAFLALVRENRNGAFHETKINMYVPWLDMTHNRTLELSRLMAVFQLLASDDSKSISRAVDFHTVFTTTKDERVVGRFRNWAVRQA